MFTFTGTTEPFVLFSASHLAAMAVLAASCALLYALRGRIARHDTVWRRVLAGALIAQEIALAANRVVLGIWTVQESLPLHLCSLCVIFVAVMLLTDSYRIFEVMYFWGLAGATQAILTPDIAAFGYPHFRYYQFFLSHGLIVFGTLYMVFVRGFRPTLRSIPRVMIVTNILLPVIGLVNRITGGNYFFIARKPETASVIDYLGPWPWYILVLEGVALVLFLAFYAPVGISRRRRIRASAG